MFHSHHFQVFTRCPLQNVPSRVPFSKSTVFVWTGGLSVTFFIVFKMCRYRVNGRPIRHIFHRFQNVLVSCEREAYPSHFSSFSKCAGIVWTGGLSVTFFIVFKMCWYRVNGRPIRHIFHRFQNVPVSCEREAYPSHFSSFSKCAGIVWTGGLSVTFFIVFKMCRYRVNGRPIRHIFHRFQNVPVSCEREAYPSHFSSFSKCAGIVWTGGLSVTFLIVFEMCRYRVNGRPIRHIFHRFQNVLVSCEREAYPSHFSSFSKCAGIVWTGGLSVTFFIVFKMCWYRVNGRPIRHIFHRFQNVLVSCKAVLVCLKLQRTCKGFLVTLSFKCEA